MHMMLVLQSLLLSTFLLLSKASPYKCIDTFEDKDCATRKEIGECESFHQWMTLSCAKTCEKCDSLEELVELSQCKDNRDDCASHVREYKGCEKYPDCGFCEQHAKWFTSAFSRLEIPPPAELQQRAGQASSATTGVGEAAVDVAGSYASSSKSASSSINTEQPPGECVDKEKDCEMRRVGGQCEEFPVWMSEFCAKSCGCKPPAKHPNMIDDGSGCVDLVMDCAERQKTGHCDKYSEWMTENCPRSCGRCSMQSHTKLKPYDPSAPCLDADGPECQHVQADQCANYPMTALRCPVSCHTCHLLDPAVRCDNAHLKLPMTPAYTPGQMDTVLSGVKREQEHRFQVATLSNTPWVMQVDEFLLPEEVSPLLESVGSWTKRSDLNLPGQNNAVGAAGGLAFCHSRCQRLAKSYIASLAIMLRVPVENIESLQFMHLLPNDTYTSQHEYVASQVDALYGNTMISGLIFFTDAPTSSTGGELTFPKLKIRVKPVVGRLVLWAVSTADNITAPETRTEHVFEPFSDGDHFLASFNIHVRNFKLVNQWQCGDLYHVNPYDV